jgi:hypothetical protein
MVNQNILILRPKFNIFWAIFIRLFLTFNTSDRNPLQGVYQNPEKLVKNQVLSILAFPDVYINVSEIF